MRTLRVVGALMRASLLTAMQYRSDFIFDGITGLFRTFAQVAPLWIVYAHTERVMGWSLPDAMLVMALYLLMEAIVGGVVAPNLGEVVEAIRTGTLDLVLIKPADAQLLCSLRRVDPSRIWDVGAAIAVGSWALARMPTPSTVDVAVAAAMVVFGQLSIYGLWVLVICTSFFFVRVDNLRYLLEAVTESGRWPITVFTGWVRWVLTVLIPVGVITSFPAMAMRGLWSPSLVVVGALVAGLFVGGSRVAWKRSLASYTSASS